MAEDQTSPVAPVLASRNQSLGFAQRTLRNLVTIEEARDAGKDVHVVTQRVVSLVGVVVFPWAEGVEESIKARRLQQLGPGWPQWDVFLGTSDTLGDLLWHLRNAISHRRLHFSSDSPDPGQVGIEFTDAPNQNAAANWGARIGADDLKLFLQKFIKLVDDSLG
jgi:hypothetical protein